MIFVQVFSASKFNSPLLSDQFGHDLKCRSAIGPFEDFGLLCRRRAKSFGIGHRSDPAQVQSVGVPTSLDGDVGLMSRS